VVLTITSIRPITPSTAIAVNYRNKDQHTGYMLRLECISQVVADEN